MFCVKAVTPENATQFMRKYNPIINFHRSDETIRGRDISSPGAVFKSYEKIPAYTFVIESYSSRDSLNDHPDSF
ncbi:hypothetical protein N39L_54580 [Limnospira platensis NIES-39]|uniref:Uncharacterized protein n=1 Tax=Limnospira platensis NIES-46 TaxID=1236695 RepID=A0A5M3T3V0_LIMPL|nr:hypothetical protein N39L_54580 [Arthrospira platensis NIES-39]GCE92561.1 hypothetical protein NIES46_06010 [Arthrospira platensis NIES-46]